MSRGDATEMNRKQYRHVVGIRSMNKDSVKMLKSKNSYDEVICRLVYNFKHKNSVHAYDVTLLQHSIPTTWRTVTTASLSRRVHRTDINQTTAESTDHFGRLWQPTVQKRALTAFERRHGVPEGRAC